MTSLCESRAERPNSLRAACFHLQRHLPLEVRRHLALVAELDLKRFRWGPGAEHEENATFSLASR